jgi:adenylate cyclase
MDNLAIDKSARTQEREVTLLFGDLRGSTDLAASLEMDPLVCEMLGHVLDCITEAVLEYSGLVVDYYGDGLMAMWNAPAEEPEHANLACRAALQMLERLPEVADDWIGVIQSHLRLGIGVHTGTVQVGNAGSTKQVKYGPRGPNVHVCSRVEAATKELGVPLVATEATVRQLSSEFAIHRVCRARMPGLREPINLYALQSPESDKRLSQAWQSYDAALRQFERGQFQEAADLLLAIESASVENPARFLSDHVQRELGRNLRRRSSDRPPAHHGVISLSAK